MLFLLSLLLLLAVPAVLGDSSPPRYACTREKRLNGECRWCTRDSHSTGGVWSIFPPYWQYPDCPMQYFTPAQVQKCLSGRTLYAMGNSIGRQALFNMVELLGGNPVKREDQRDQCPKHETTWDDSCHADFANVKLKYLYIQFPDGFHYADRNGFPYFRYQQTTSDGKRKWTTGKLKGENGEYLENANENIITKLWGYDNCVDGDVRSCYARFFNGSKKEDILFISHGLPVPIGDKEPPDGKVDIDNYAWVVASAAALKGHIQATFPGQVFRANMPETNKFMSYSYLSPMFDRVNRAVEPIWAPGSEDLPWYTIDQWAINKDRHHYYSDHIHFNGILSHAGLFQLLNELCPGGGTTTWTYPKDGQASSVYNQSEAIIMRLPLSATNNWFMAMYKGVRHDFPNMDTLVGMEIPPSEYYTISKEDLNLFVAGDPVPACDKASRIGCTGNLFYKLLHKFPVNNDS